MLMGELISRAELVKVDQKNIDSMIAGLRSFREVSRNPDYSLEPPHRYVPFLAQISHESMGFRRDEEIWGPTDAQKRYEGRADLGNTRPGDGFRFRGRTMIQSTGRANAKRFTSWCRSYWYDCPDFEADPDQMLVDPWGGLCPIWFWNVGNQTGNSLNYYADEGNFEAITRKINGGLNGYADRCDRYVRYGLLVLGFSPHDVRGFQKQAKLDVDGIAGQKTRAAIHTALKELDSSVTPIESLRLPVVDGFTTLTKEVFIKALEAWGE